MSNLDNLRKIHDTAIVEPVDRELFWVEYPGLILLIGIKYLMAFYAHDKWHCYIGKNSKQLTEYKEKIKENISIDVWHPDRQAMQHELLRLIEDDEK
ncbi:MAG: hypothetical protein WC465_04835 [Patescibacteria group bacterium]